MHKLKSFLYITLAVFLLVGSAGCSAFKSTTSENTTNINTTGKTLIVYFSMPETTNPNNMTREEDNSVVVIDGKVIGNTEYVANIIQEQINADIIRLEPEQAYPTEHKTLVNLARNEKDENARPALKTQIDNIAQYDTIFIGYPIWWADMPMIMYSFFDKYDFSGKTIIPFSTHGGSGLAGTVEKIQEYIPNAKVIENAYSVSRDDVQEAKPEIIDWLKTLGY